MIRLGIVGSRNFEDYELFKRAVLKTLSMWNINISNISYIISGGAKGTDTLAERFAGEYGIKPLIFKPEYWKYPKNPRRAPLERNTTIVENSHYIIAFPSRTGSGTQDSISKAKSRNIPTQVLYID